MNIATRTACVGGMVCHELFGDNHDFFNQVKGRVDIVLDIKKYGTKRAPTRAEMEHYIVRKEGIGLYWQAADLLHFTLKDPPKYALFDQYSELTDKRFEHKNGFAFSGHYGHVDVEAFNNKELTDMGMLDTSLIQDKYDEYFDFMKSRWPSTIFLFIHFPIDAETRFEYIAQWEAIAAAMDNLAGKYSIQNVHADKDSIESVGDGDVYHYTSKTAKNIASKIKI